MSYTKTTWGDGDVITAAKLNNMEDGISQNDTYIANIMKNIAPEFDETITYYAGDYVLYNGRLYCFLENHNAGSWRGITTHVKSVKVDEMLKTVNKIIPQWKSGVVYNAGDFVQYNGLVYKRKDTNSTANYSFSSDEWDVSSNVLTFFSNWLRSLVPTYQDMFFDYAVGDLCVYNGNIYRCAIAITGSSTSHPFDESEWQQTSLYAIISSLQNNVDTINNDISQLNSSMIEIGEGFASPMEPGAYKIGDYATYNGKLYRCIQAIDTTGSEIIPFVSICWEEASVMDLVDEIYSNLALPWVQSREYAVGDYVRHGGGLGHEWLWICRVACPANTPWASVNWDHVYTMNEIKKIDTEISELENDTTEKFDETTTWLRSLIMTYQDVLTDYAVGDFCVYEGTVYRCTTAITGSNTSHPFDVTEWQQTNLNAILSNIYNKISNLETRIAALENQLA